MGTFKAADAARFIADAHANRSDYENLSGALAPGSIAEAYDAQEALRDLWVATRGPVAGLKIATTTKVMQELMGIDHPCGGMIFEKRIYASPSNQSMRDHIHPMIECELAVRLGQDLPKRDTPYTAADVREAVGSVMAAFEIIEDRRADYKSTDVKTLIADNSWNAGIVIGPEVTVQADRELNGIAGQLTKNGKPSGEGRTDGPMDALAWVANLAVERNHPLTKGMIVITGSVIATFPAHVGDHLVFELEGIGRTEMTFSE